MIHVFMLVLMINGAEQKGSAMYFYDIDRCLYFANRLSKQRNYRAICKPVLTDPSKTRVYE
jgi:hypothetical protein